MTSESRDMILMTETKSPVAWAALFAHEMKHVANGEDEIEAYRTQFEVLKALYLNKELDLERVLA
jgi:hypothetical protein